MQSSKRQNAEKGSWKDNSDIEQQKTGKGCTFHDKREVHPHFLLGSALKIHLPAF